MQEQTIAIRDFAVRNRTALIIGLIAFGVFTPFIFLRDKFHDSWARLWAPVDAYFC